MSNPGSSGEWTSAPASAGWGPSRKAGSFSLTFDNLGEAFELEQGTFPQNQTVGNHYTATDTLPALLRLLDGLPSTFFIEASNVALYPQQIKSVHEAGHEVAMHAWRHENWSKQDGYSRKDILRRSMGAFETLDITPKGFRPPGGVLLEGSIRELVECGLAYCSPLGNAGDTAVQDGLALLPFSWHHVDSYMMNPKNRALRTANGDPADPFSLVQWEEAINKAVDLSLTGKHVTVVFHALLLGVDAGMLDILKRLIGRLREESRLWLAMCGDVAEWAHRRAVVIA